jgi:serine protease
MSIGHSTIRRTLAVLALSGAGYFLAGGDPARATNQKQARLRGPHEPGTSASHPSDEPRSEGARRERPAIVPGHILVKFEGSATVQSVERTAREVGATAVRRVSYADFVYVDLPRGADPVAAAAALQGRPGVVYAEPDAAVYPFGRPNDPLYQYQWNLQKIDMERAWDINPGAANSIVVAVVDTGVAYLNEGPFAQAPDLRGTRFVPGYDFVWDDTQPVDLDNHGTHVTGTVAQTTNNSEGTAGIAYNVSIMPVKVLVGDWDIELDAPFPYGASTVARGIRFAAENGAKVINLSLGNFFPNTATEDALRFALSRGAFVAIAAGNQAEACTGCPPGIGPNPVAYPAKYAETMDGVMAVGALGYDMRRAPYSNFQSYVEIAAPGGNLRTDMNTDGFADGVLQQTLAPVFVSQGIFNRFGYFFFQGTSMATPHVTAFAALLMDQGVTSPAAIEAAIRAYATDVDPPGRDPQTGFGVLNPRSTLLGLGLLR